MLTKIKYLSVLEHRFDLCFVNLVNFRTVRMALIYLISGIGGNLICGLFSPLPPQVGAQAPVVRKLDNAIYRINHYPVDSVVCFVNAYPLVSDISAG